MIKINVYQKEFEKATDCRYFNVCKVCIAICIQTTLFSQLFCISPNVLGNNNTSVKVHLEAFNDFGIAIDTIDALLVKSLVFNVLNDPPNNDWYIATLSFAEIRERYTKHQRSSCNK